MRLRRQMGMFITLSLVSVLVVFCIIADWAFRSVTASEGQQTLARHLSYLKLTLTRQGCWDELFLNDYAHRQGVRITVIGTDGTVLSDSKSDPVMMDNHALRKEIKEALEGKQGTDTRTSATNGLDTSYLASLLPLSPPIVLRVGLELSSVSVWRSLFARQLLPVLAVLFVFLLAVSLLFVRHLTKPLSQINDLAGEYMKGNLKKRIWVEGPDEIRNVGAILEEMAGRLSLQFDHLQTDRSRFSTILETMTEAVILVDRKRQVILANGEAKRRFGDEAAILGMIPDSDLLTLLARTLDEDTNGTCTIQNGKAILQVSIAPIHQEGTVTGAVITMNDITDLKRLERVRKDFVANVSHELKSPLTSLLGFSDILCRDDLSEEDRKQFALIIKRNSGRMMGIINDLLMLATLERDEERIPMQDNAIKEILSDTLQDTSYKAQQKQTRVVVEDHTGEDGHVYCSKNLLVEALRNLVMNAILYSPEHSVVTVQAGIQGETLVFSVADHGCGIAKEDQERIFERFYRVDKARSHSEGGTGLGLSIVRHVAMIHHGSVEVQSEPGKGSTFTFTLPLQGNFSEMRARSDRLLSSDPV